MRALNEFKQLKYFHNKMSKQRERLGSLCLCRSTARLIVLTDGVSFRSLQLQLPLLTWQLANLNVVADVVDNERRQF